MENGREGKNLRREKRKKRVKRLILEEGSEKPAKSFPLILLLNKNDYRVNFVACHSLDSPLESVSKKLCFKYT
jgi:hypothetical protein